MTAETATMPIAALTPAEQLRVAGVNHHHVRALAEVKAALPPILVHRSTKRVIDGMHRLRAAEARGLREIEVRFYDGATEDAFVLAVEANVAHGLPLSLRDRTAAATRIISGHPEWSDRKIASVTGLAATTVGAIRRRSSECAAQVTSRVGRDGRARPLNGVAGRMLASELMRDRPDASLREIAKAAGISPSTAHDVRERLRGGKNPVPARLREAAREETAEERGGPGSTGGRDLPQAQAADRSTILGALKRDPSLRFTESGRALLRWLDAHTSGVEEWTELFDNVPAHCRGVVAELARGACHSWHEFAERLENGPGLGARPPANPA
ncbi:ParB/RepB/Spo0J family partition protein [Saccharopolyspora sp. MS10]|uniref:ParB/RepB/Spo0J family partition protein n=1 Tax=Saccharopolyspora sp. MS10 TaxID=3385973 RepID=UPI00399F1A30